MSAQNEQYRKAIGSSIMTVKGYGKLIDSQFGAQYSDRILEQLQVLADQQKSQIVTILNTVRSRLQAISIRPEAVAHPTIRQEIDMCVDSINKALSGSSDRLTVVGHQGQTATAVHQQARKDVTHRAVTSRSSGSMPVVGPQTPGETRADPPRKIVKPVAVSPVDSNAMEELIKRKQSRTVPVPTASPEGEEKNWLDDYPDRSIAMSIGKLRNVAAGATIHGKDSSSVQQENAGENLKSAPLCYRDLLQHITRGELVEFETLMERVCNNSAELQSLCQFVERSSEYSASADRICKTVVKILKKNNRAIPTAYVNFHKKIRMGVLGWENRNGLKSKEIELQDKLGEGGMGAVYLAQKQGEDRKLVVKLVAGTEDNQQREYQLLSRFKQHDPAVFLIEGGKMGVHTYLVMPFLEGAVDLSQARLNTLQKFVACLKVAESVECVHSAGVIHRDIKPANFLARGLEGSNINQLRKSAQVNVIDFGVARKSEETVTPEEDQLPEGHPKKRKSLDRVLGPDEIYQIFGTPLYMSKQQAMSEELDESCDIYAEALTMYNVLTGTVPSEFIGKNTLTLMGRKVCNNGTDIDENDPKLVALAEGLTPDSQKAYATVRKALSQAAHSDNTKRPNAKRLREVWEKFIETLTPEYQEQKRIEKEAKQNASEARKNAALSTRRTFIAKMLGGALLLGGVSVPVILSNLNQQLKTEFVSERDRKLSEINQLFSSKKWQDVMTLVGTEMDTVRDSNILEGAEKSARIDVLKEKRTQANANLEALARATALISEGDRLLDPKFSDGRPDPNTASNLEGAREKYRDAQAASAEMTQVVIEKLREVDRRECRNSYTRGLGLYNRGESAADEFRKITDLERVGLTDEQRVGLMRRLEILKNWQEVDANLRQEVLDAYQNTNPDQFRAIIDTWVRQANVGNINAASKILLMRAAMVEITNPTPEIVAKFERIYRAVFEINSIIGTVQNPQALRLLQFAYIQSIVAIRGKFQTLIVQKNYDEYTTKIIMLLENIKALNFCIDTDTQLDDIDGPSLDVKLYIRSIFADAINGARIGFGDDEIGRARKAELLSQIRQKFGNDDQIMRLATDALTLEPSRKR